MVLLNHEDRLAVRLSWSAFRLGGLLEIALLAISFESHGVVSSSVAPGEAVAIGIRLSGPAARVEVLRANDIPAASCF
jgi:hypothetical protein